MNETRGRRRGAPDTRSEILGAARTVFSEHGYDGASIRTIAGRAEVDPALIYHYFSTKEELFAASIDLPPAVLDIVDRLGTGGPGDVGRTLAVTFFEVWEDDDARTSLLGILRSATGGEERAVAAFRQFLTSTVIDQIAPRLPGSNAELRALLMASHLVGVAIARYVMRLEPVASKPVGEIIDLVAPRIQSYVDSPP